MKTIIIISNGSASGNTFTALGLALGLKALGKKVGYVKPLGKSPVRGSNGGVCDDGALFMKDTIGIEEQEATVSPFVLTFESSSALYTGNAPQAQMAVLNAIKAQERDDYVIVSAGRDLFEGSAFGISAMQLMEKTDGVCLMNENWRGDSSTDSILGYKRLLGDRLIGAVINVVPENSVAHVRETVKPFIEKAGVEIFGIFARDRLLESITVRQISDILGAKVLCAEDRLDEYVENFLIGAMDVDSALNYFRRTNNKAVITGAHRSDIQLAALETSTRCIILTGGLYTNDVVLGKAVSKGVPVLSVTEDTFTTVNKIESVVGKAKIRGAKKVERVREMFSECFDMKGFEKRVKGKQGKA